MKISSLLKLLNEPIPRLPDFEVTISHYNHGNIIGVFNIDNNNQGFTVRREHKWFDKLEGIMANAKAE